MSENIEKIENQEELAQVRRQASKVQLKTLAASLVMTAIALLLP